jgi:hypothetical protein
MWRVTDDGRHCEWLEETGLTAHDVEEGLKNCTLEVNVFRKGMAKEVVARYLQNGKYYNLIIFNSPACLEPVGFDLQNTILFTVEKDPKNSQRLVLPTGVDISEFLNRASFTEEESQAAFDAWIEENPQRFPIPKRWNSSTL